MPQRLREGARFIGFLGTATTSRSLAPFEDPEWEIWATGPGCHNDPNFKSQFDRWFEFHNMGDNDPQYGTVLDPGYFQWLQGIADEKTVYYKPPLYPGLKGELFTWDEISKHHSGYFLDSTVAIMMAFAYEYFEPEKIGIWGIDFATDQERIKQKKGAKHFIELFKLKGVPCEIPDVSDMAFDPLPYTEKSKLGKKLDQHLKLLQPERNKTEKMIEDLRLQLHNLREHYERIKGTEQTLEYFRDNCA